MLLWLLRPCALILLVVLSSPVVALVLGVSVADVHQAALDPDVWDALRTSFLCATCATALGIILGVPAGYLLARSGRIPRRVVGALVDLPLVIPHPVIGLGLLAIFGQRRLIGSALHDSLGVEVTSAAPGIVLAMLVVSAPFIVKAARDAFWRLPPDYSQTASSLGASDVRVFFRVLLPLVRQPIATGAIMAWGRALSEFGSVMILAYYPRTAPVLIWDRFSTQGLQAATAPALVLCALCVMFFFLVQPVAGASDAEP